MSVYSIIIALLLIGITSIAIAIPWFTNFSVWTYVIFIALVVISHLIVLGNYLLFFPNKRMFKIKKGRKRSYWKPSFHFGRTKFKWDFMFYKGIKREIDTATQKIVGFSYGKHHNNSWRLGFRIIENDRVVVYPYYYINGVRKEDRHLGRIIASLDKCTIYVEVEKEMVECTLMINDKVKAKWVSNRGFEPKPGYYLYPYYEDKNGKGASQDIKIEIHDKI